MYASVQCAQDQNQTYLRRVQGAYPMPWNASCSRGSHRWPWQKAHQECHSTIRGKTDSGAQTDYAAAGSTDCTGCKAARHLSDRQLDMLAELTALEERLDSFASGF